MREMTAAPTPHRPRHMPPRLLVVIVWGLFAGLCLMMTRTDGDFTPAAQIGFYVGATVCGSFCLITFVLWMYEIAGTIVGNRESQWADSGVPPSPSGDLEDMVKRSDQEIRYAEAEDIAADVAPERGIDLSPAKPNSSRRKNDVLDVFRYIRIVFYAIMGGLTFLGIALAAVKAGRTWAGLIERQHPDDIYFEFISIAMLLQIPVFCWIKRSHLTTDPRRPWENAVLLLVAAELISLFTSIALGVVVVVILVIVELASNGGMF